MHQVLHHLGIVFEHHRMSDGEVEPGTETAHRMIDARTAEHRIALEQFVGNRTRFEADECRA